MTTTIDYDLLKKYKNTKRVSYRNQLLLNYHPKIKKEAYKIYKKTSNWDYEDIYQELSIFFLQQIEKININKIRNTADFGIWGFVRGGLHNFKSTTIYGSGMKRIVNHAELTPQLHKQISFENSCYTQEYTERLLKDFKEEITDSKDKKVWKELFKKHKIKDIQDSLGSNIAVYNRVERLHNQFEKYVEQNAIY